MIKFIKIVGWVKQSTTQKSSDENVGLGYLSTFLKNNLHEFNILTLTEPYWFLFFVLKIQQKILF